MRNKIAVIERHCERSEAIQSTMQCFIRIRATAAAASGLLPRFAPRNDGMRSGFWLVIVAPLALTACQQHNAYLPGTPEYAASIVSRGYDCGLRVDRGRVVAVYRGDERRRLIATNQALAVGSYNLPRACSEIERASVASELRAIAQR